MVLENGRVLDPETGLDAIRNVGIRGRVIEAISEGPLEGDRGDRRHGPRCGTRASSTSTPTAKPTGRTSFRRETGSRPPWRWRAESPTSPPILGQRSERARSLNFGATVAHRAARSASVMPEYRRGPGEAWKSSETTCKRCGPSVASPELGAASGYETLSGDLYPAMQAELAKGLAEGALGNRACPTSTTQGQTTTRSCRCSRPQPSSMRPIFTHVRDMTHLGHPGSRGQCRGDRRPPPHRPRQQLEPVEHRGRPRDHRRRAGRMAWMSPRKPIHTRPPQRRFSPPSSMTAGRKSSRSPTSDVQWQDTGERLTEETFRSYREQGGVVIIHMMKPEWIEAAVTSPFVMVASDGMPYAPGAHPRSAGTFSRFLGRYVRDEGLMTLMEGVRRRSPSCRLSASNPCPPR